MKKEKGQSLASYWWKVHGYTSRSSPPLWYPFFACQPTDRSSLIRHPINRDVCARFSLIETCCHDTSGEFIVIGVLNPWHCCIMYIRLVTGVNVIDSDLNFNGFVRIEHVRLQMDHYTVRISQCWNVRHVLATALEWKNWKKKRERESIVLLLNSLCFNAMSLNKHVNKLALIAMNVCRRPVPIVHGNFWAPLGVWSNFLRF